MRIKLVKGDTGTDVRELQARLISAGYSVEHDGWFGDNTEAAVRAFQRKAFLVADGIAGPKTIAALAGRASSLHLGQTDIDAAAEMLGVPVAALMAVNEVESRGEGFLNGNPIVLFERHVMHRRLDEAGKDADVLAARYPDLVNPKRGGYRGGAQEWYRLCLLYTSPSPRDKRQSRMPSSA